MNVTITGTLSSPISSGRIVPACIDERVQRIVAGLNARAQTDRRARQTNTALDIDGICYVETVDGRTFLYTGTRCTARHFGCIELEGQTGRRRIRTRIKQLLANFDHVVAIRPAINARLQRCWTTENR